MNNEYKDWPKVRLYYKTVPHNNLFSQQYQAHDWLNKNCKYYFEQADEDIMLYIQDIKQMLVFKLKFNDIINNG